MTTRHLGSVIIGGKEHEGGFSFWAGMREEEEKEGEMLMVSSLFDMPKQNQLC